MQIFEVSIKIEYTDDSGKAPRLVDAQLSESQLIDDVLNRNGGGMSEESTVKTMEHLDQLQNGNSVTWTHPTYKLTMEVEEVPAAPES